MRYCTNCLYPETKPDLTFNDLGICSACKAAEEKNKGIDWKKREKDFHEVISHFKKSTAVGYDCLIPVSGGKDSTYQAYFMKEVCGLNPLCVCFETTAVTELGQRNLDNISKMGIDVIHFKKNYVAYKKMVVESFKRVGDEMWPNHIGIFTIPVMIAVKFNIPLIIWGENPQQEYGGPNLDSVKNRVLNRKWLEEFGGLLGNRIQDMVGVDGITEKELTPYFYPSDEDIERVGVTGIFLGHYFFWDARKQLEIVEKYGFKVKEDGPTEGTYTNYENIDEKLVSLHDYLKYVKYGFGRATDHACIDIRNKRITRAEGLKLIKEFDGKYPHYGVTEFVKYSEMSKDEVDEVINSFTNPILFQQDDTGKFKRDNSGNLLRNFEVE
ncbi:MAG: N-acetyl sugar amidotransferase [Bacteroidetes bacterium]|nr:N-acetyl sugar amidotransferase [Bacteroidota bacterium]